MIRADQLSNYRNLWVAVLGENIVASAPNFDEVHSALTQLGIHNALVLRVNESLFEKRYLIANGVDRPQ